MKRTPLLGHPAMHDEFVIIAQALEDVDAFLVGGCLRNAVYQRIHDEALPQRDYDMVILQADKDAVEQALIDIGFTYADIRREKQTAMVKVLDPSLPDFEGKLVLDINFWDDPYITAALSRKINFTINGFALDVQDLYADDWMQRLTALESAERDITEKRLRLNPNKTRFYGTDIYACIRFVHLGFAPPPPEQIQRLVQAFDDIPAHKRGRNIRKVFEYVGGRRRAQELSDKLGIKKDLFG